MKKGIFILVVILLSTLLSGGAIAATNGPHGSYVADTTACGQCHNTHASAGANLFTYALLGTDNATYEACIYCHKASGQSKYDTVNGAIFNTTDSKYYQASGGGIDNTLTTEGVASIAGNVTATTSTHEVKAKGGSLQAPGGNTATVFSELSCSDCHSPHGTANARQLLTTVNGVTSLAPALTITSPLGNEAVTYTANFSNFCGSCHTDFNVKTAGSGDTGNGTYSTKKRHRIDVDPSTYPGYNASHGLPLEAGKLTCMTCHYAHGTSVANTVTFDRSETYNGAATSTSSALLRKANRGVCEACHNK